LSSLLWLPAPEEQKPLPILGRHAHGVIGPRVALAGEVVFEIHPTIDACIQLRNEHKLVADLIDRIELRVHPLVLELTGKKTPATGLESKFSVYFAAALAIVVGAALCAIA
jgi:2-methylcitrate dehydratase PrpD